MDKEVFDKATRLVNEIKLLEKAIEKAEEATNVGLLTNESYGFQKWSVVGDGQQNILAEQFKQAIITIYKKAVQKLQKELDKL